MLLIHPGGTQIISFVATWSFEQFLQIVRKLFPLDVCWHQSWGFACGHPGH